MTDERKPETPGMSEVSPKFMDKAEAAVEAETSTDKALSTLWQECQRLRQQYGEAVEETDLAFTAKQAITETETPEYRVASTAHKTADQHQQEVSNTILATENRMAKMPARTVMGALFKLRAAGVEITDEFKGRDGVLDETLLGSMEHLILSALADLERLTGQEFVAVPTIEDPVLVLKREWEARYQLLDEQRDDPAADDSDEAVQPFFDRLRETEIQILRTQATTPAEIAVKLILWARLHCDANEVSGLSWTRKSIEGHPHDLDRLPVMSALLDLERMSQGIAPSMIQEPTIDEPLLALERRWREAEKAVEEEKTDWRSISKVQDEIIATPARSIAGVLVKLRVYGDIEQENAGVPKIDQMPLSELEGAQAAVVGAMRDLERLVGKDMPIPGSPPPQRSPLFSQVSDMETPIIDAEGAVEALWLLVEDGKLCPDAAEPIAYLVTHLNGHIQEQRRLFDELFVAAGGSAA